MPIARIFLAFLLFAPIASCIFHSDEQRAPRPGTWRVELQLLDRTLPFEWVLQRNDNAWVAKIHNAAEEIVIRDVRFHADTFTLRMPLFDSEFKGILVNDSTIQGFWHNYLRGPDHRMPFKAMAGVEHRFPGEHDGHGAFAGKWEAHFSKGTKDAYGAIGLFDQHPGGHITGTFITETGDYRFLEGVVHQDSMQLSSFDGSHAFLFAARLHADSMVGRFWSGDHWQEPWVAYRNTSYELRHPDSLTFMREGHTVADFKFPDLEGESVSPHDDRFRGKVLLLQVMGSWCANCVDETVTLKSFYDTYAGQGLEVIAIAFEKHVDPKKAIAGLKRFRQELGVKYPIVYAGMASKQQAAEKLPFLNHILSYPTCVFIGRNGQVRRIRTGFYGPGTGQHHVAYINELRAFIEELLAEPMPR